MKRLRSDTAENVLYLTLSGEVTASDVDRLERDAVVAARVLDDGFTLLVDLSTCETVTQPAAERVHAMREKIDSFGLTQEVRMVSDSTASEVQRQLDGDAGWDVQVVREYPVSTGTQERSVDVGRC